MLAQIISLGVRRISNLLGCLSGDFLLNKLVRVDFGIVIFAARRPKP